MVCAAPSLEHLLEEERRAALRADTEALAALQDEKRAALSRLLAEGLAGEDLERIRQKAAANLGLMRHLAACLAGMLSKEAPTYQPNGSRVVASSVGRVRGRL